MANIGQDADIGWGVTVTWSGDTYSLKSFDGPSEAADAVESTHSQSTSKYRTFIEGLLDAGELTLTCNFAPNEAITFGEGVGTLVVTFPGPNTFTCSAVLTGRSPAAEVDGVMEQDVSWKLTGVPVWA